MALKGPALGPELFVDAVIKAYTSWIEREVVNGPVGERIRGKDGSGRQTKGKVIIAGVLPPLIEDETLPQVPNKYVDRLAEEHAAKERILSAERNGGVSRTPWSQRGAGAVDPLEHGVSTMTLTDDKPPTPHSSVGSAISSAVSSAFDSAPDSASVRTDLTSPLTQPDSEPQTPATPARPAPANPNKVTVSSLLKHDPPVCTLPVRIAMSKRFNTLLREFCEKYPYVLSFIDITPEMLEKNDPSYKAQFDYQADRSVWACPVDPSNIHPLWEPTLPLWLKDLEKLGVPASSFKLSVDAEASFKAYEEDKTRRMQERWRASLGEE